ncbi:MAG: hypothetical protein E2590_01300 [Chryseobacterium sp.]|nr:hypothetical protein [Chryseobacterium sp.]
MIDKISKYYQIFKESSFYKNIWADAVWSKVISAGIIAILGSFCATIFLLCKSLILNIPFGDLYSNSLLFFTESTKVNNTLISLCTLIILVALFFFSKSIYLKSTLYKNKDNRNYEEELPLITEHSTSFFSYRIAKAFPGQRGLRWYDAEEANKRLKILLKEPIRFKANGNYATGDPIWWFRGQRAMFIDIFKPLSKTKILLGIEQIEIEKIAVYVSDSYYKSFIYIQANAEEPTGIYDLKKDDIELYKEKWGYYTEEYGLLGKKIITRQEYDDGAAIINGKIMDASNSELRVRHVTPYNFIIAAKQSPYNSRNFMRETGVMFDNLLKNKFEFESFLIYLDSLEKKE